MPTNDGILIGYISNKTLKQLKEKATTGGYAKVCRIYTVDELSKMKNKAVYTAIYTKVA